MNCRESIGAIALACALGCASAVAAPRDMFTVRAVDRASGEHGFSGLALNDLGQVVGQVSMPDDVDWYTGPDGTGATTLPSALMAAHKYAGHIYDINNAGQIVGSYKDCVCTWIGRAFVTSPDGSTFTDLQPAGQAQSVGNAIDDQGAWH